MDSGRFARVRAIFEEVDGLPRDEAERVAALRAEGDEALLAEVLALVRANVEEDDLLDPWVAAIDGGRSPVRTRPAPGERIGEFVLRRRIGSGGMGTVYEAEQEEPRRIVALKTLRDGLASPEARERFRWESRVLARLEHPAIARVYAVGTFRSGDGDATPYFVMEYVEGARTIREWIEEDRPPREEILRSFCTICSAVQHGHDRGVLHRDLKPQNLLVDRNGNPKVIDFGVARALDPEVTAPRTSAGELIGTLAYMSPEQVLGPGEEIDVRTDVYALGVVLYELLCGTKPVSLEGRSLGEAVAAIRDEPPRRPGALVPSLKGDLEWICLRALEKDPERRYPSPGALADDLERHLADLPVAAGPPGVLYRLGKFVRRNRLAVALGAAFVLALAAGAVVSLRQFLRAEAEIQVRDRVSVFLADMLTRARPEVALGPELTVRELLDWAAGELEGRFHDRPLVEAHLRNTIGEAYVALGRYDDAERHLTRAAGLIEREQGAFSPEHVVLLCALCRLDSSRGDHQAAVERYERILPRVREYFAGEHDALSATLVNYAIALFDVGRTDEALGLAREVLESRRSRYGAVDTRVLTVSLTLAAQLALAGHAEEAGELYEEVRRGLRALPNAHVAVPNFANEYGGFLLMRQRSQEAVEVFEEGYRTASAMYGDDHANVLVVRANLANALIHSDRVDEGMAHYDAVFRLDRDLPTDRFGSAGHRLIYVEGLRRAGRLDEARIHLDLWTKEAVKTLPDDHPMFRMARDLRARLDPSGGG